MDNPFPVIVVIGLTVFGLAFIATLDDVDLGIGLGEDEDREEVEIFNQNIGQVGASQEAERTARFGNFTVGDLRGDVQVYRSERESISRGLVMGDSIEFTYNATQPRGGTVTFEVLGRKGTGSVFVEVNGERVFEEAMIQGNKPEIDIPSGHFNTGDNKVVIGTTKSGLISSASYELHDVEVEVNDRTFHDRTEGFQVYDYELEDMREVLLTFSIDSSIENEPLHIQINNNTIIDETTPRVTGRVIEIDPNEADLNPGRNQIEFSTGRQSEYIFENAYLTFRYIRAVKREDVNVAFNLNPAEKDFVEDEETVEEVRFNYQNLLPSPREIQISLNDENQTLIPSNGKNKWKVPEGTLEEENNELNIESDGAYRMENLRLVSEKKEE